MPCASKVSSRAQRLGPQAVGSAAAAVGQIVGAPQKVRSTQYQKWLHEEQDENPSGLPAPLASPVKLGQMSVVPLASFCGAQPQRRGTRACRARAAKARGAPLERTCKVGPKGPSGFMHLLLALLSACAYRFMQKAQPPRAPIAWHLAAMPPLSLATQPCFTVQTVKFVRASEPLSAIGSR